MAAWKYFAIVLAIAWLTDRSDEEGHVMFMLAGFGAFGAIGYTLNAGLNGEAVCGFGAVAAMCGIGAYRRARFKRPRQ